MLRYNDILLNENFSGLLPKFLSYRNDREIPRKKNIVKSKGLYLKDYIFFFLHIIFFNMSF